MPINHIPGFDRQNEYEKFLFEIREVEEKAVMDYVSILNTISRILCRYLTAHTVETAQQINDIAKLLTDSAELKDSCIPNYKTALRHYCRALNGHEPR